MVSVQVDGIRKDFAPFTVLGKGSESFGHEHLEFRVNQEFTSLILSVSVNRYMGSGGIPLGTWILRARPVISDIEPTFELPGENVTLKGKHFTHGSSAPVVRFDGIAANVVSYADESLVGTWMPNIAPTMSLLLR